MILYTYKINNVSNETDSVVTNHNAGVMADYDVLTFGSLKYECLGKTQIYLLTFYGESA